MSRHPQHPHDQDPEHEHESGLSHDLPRIVERNRLGRRRLFAPVGDGSRSLQLATVTGSLDEGCTMSLPVPV
jgi:hypothetical protein